MPSTPPLPAHRFYLGVHSFGSAGPGLRRVWMGVRHAVRFGRRAWGRLLPILLLRIPLLLKRHAALKHAHARGCYLYPTPRSCLLPRDTVLHRAHYWRLCIRYPLLTRAVVLTPCTLPSGRYACHTVRTPGCAPPPLRYVPHDTATRCGTPGSPVLRARVYCLTPPIHAPTRVVLRLTVFA